MRPFSTVAFVLALTLLGRSSSISCLKVRLVFMSVTPVRCPVGCASPDGYDGGHQRFLSMAVTNVLCPPSATVFLIFLSRIYA